MKKYNIYYIAIFIIAAFLSACELNGKQREVAKEIANEIIYEIQKEGDKGAEAGMIAETKADSRGGSDADDIAEADAGIADLEIPIGNSKLSATVKKRTSYTLSYNHDTKEPNWVAWVLTADRAKGKVKRMSFEDDEDMPDPKGYLADYYNSGFDRGHMCPAADNKWSEDAMRDCFLITNICPQNPSLNSGVWNTIEKQCRDWAQKYGRIYIVCGPIFLNQQHRKIGSNKVVVPEAFFKVVLCMEGTPKAIGFVCRNQSQKGRKKNEFVNTIDQVERITGYDFFSKLPDDVENVVESKCDINDWQ